MTTVISGRRYQSLAQLVFAFVLAVVVAVLVVVAVIPTVPPETSEPG